MQTNKSSISIRAVLKYQYCIVRVAVATACKGLSFPLRSVSLMGKGHGKKYFHELLTLLIFYTLFRLKVSTKIIPKNGSGLLLFYKKHGTLDASFASSPSSLRESEEPGTMTFHDILVSVLMRCWGSLPPT